MTEANTASRDSLIGAHIDGRYTVHRELGRGGMGVVYEGVHDELGRAVAIKVLNTAWASDPTAVARFLREARTASSFSHGNIVDVSDLGRLPDGRPYLVMPKIVGVDLASLLRDSGVQPAKRVAELLTGVAAALDLIHAKGFVHRDIKPENLMYVVREDGSETVMLLDFGIAAAIMSNEPRLTGQGAIFGTPQFMPPEVCGGAMPDARGDVYALATVAFELITGHLPFGDDNMMRVLTEKLTSDPPTMSHVSGIPFPPELEHVIARGLARDPDVRFPSASEFVSSLKGATEHAPISWKSGVLRPSLRSAAHPVGSHSHPSTRYDHASEGRTPSGRPLPSPLPPFPSRPAPRMSTPRPEVPRANTPRPNPYPSYDSSQWPESRGSQRPRSQHVSEPPWADSYRDEEYQLGAGLRASERTRTRSVQRSRGGLGLLLLLIAASTFAVVLWVRQEQPEALAALSGRAATDQVPSDGPGTAQPKAPGVLAPAPAQPPVTANEAPAAAQPLPNEPTSTTASNGQQPGAATTQTAEGPSGAVAAADPNAIPSPATQPQAPAIVDPGDQAALQPKAVTPPPAAPPKVSAPPLTAAPKQAAAPRAQATPPRPAVPAAVPAVPPEPPAPSGYETAGSEFPQPEDSPVLTVQEEVPPPEEEPELPVRPPEQQAAQLAKDATTALLAGEVSHAIDLLREATRLDPEHALAWRTLGLALERGGNRSGALNAYEQYIRLAPHGPQSDMVRERMRTLEQ